MQVKNEAMLITYADSLGNNLKDLKTVLEKHMKGVIGGVHILPFFPSSGDRGFAPMDYTKVDPAFGGWAEVNALAKDYYLMFDFMVNHISAQSPYFQDFQQKKDDSEWRNLFIRYKDFWPNGEPTDEQVDLIYKRKPRAPYCMAEFADGTSENRAPWLVRHQSSPASSTSCRMQHSPPRSCRRCSRHRSHPTNRPKRSWPVC